MYKYIRLIGRNLLCYIFLMVVILVLDIKEDPSVCHIGLQLMTSVSAWLLFLWIIKNNVSRGSLLFGLFIYLVSIIIIWRFFNFAVFNHMLGYNPIDAIAYHSYAEHFVLKKESLFNIIESLRTASKSLDDYGFFIIPTIIYSLFGVEFGCHILSLVNALFIIGSCNFLYKLCEIISIDKRDILTICFLFGTLTYAIYTAAAGLKENIMMFFIVGAMYYMYKFLNKKSAVALICTILFSLFLCFFRTAIAAILLTTFIISLFLYLSFVRKKLKFWTILMMGFGMATLSVVTILVADLRGGMAVNQGMVDSVAQGSSLFFQCFNLAAILVGPFPNFVSDTEKVNYITLWNFGTLVKMMLSGYFLYGIYFIYKKKMLTYYPILIFFFLHSAMLFVTMFAVHDRYQLPQIPLVFIVSFLGLSKIGYLQRPMVLMMKYCYPLLMVGLIFMYNMR